jgi:hypothetical protein
MKLQTAEEYINSIKDLSEVVIEAKQPRLPVTVLVSKGECFEQAFMFRQLRYEPVVVPTIPYSERADKSILTDKDDGGAYIPAALDHGEAAGQLIKVRSLRMSWAFALDVLPACADDSMGIVICERRALPKVDARTLYTAIKRVIREYPDTDVIRLFHTHTYDMYNLATFDYEKECIKDLPDNLSEELPAGKDVTRLSKYCDGTYAMYVSDKSRSKVAELFRDTRMPVDTALEYAAANGKLKVRTLTINAFVRAGGPKKEHVGHKYCVQLSSYNRPTQLFSQIIALKEQMRYVQDPSRVFIHIAVRGCDKLTYEVIRDRAALELAPYKHRVSALPNRSQIINFVEAPSGYDFYLKMDDDDFYDPMYLSTTVSYHDRLPADICSTMSGGDHGIVMCMKNTEQDRTIARYDKTGACENTLVFPAHSLDHLIRLAAGTKIHTTAGKATDAVPMRTLVNSHLGLNRYEYWRFISILAGRNVRVFSALSFEGSSHATSQSNYGAFAATAGPGAAEYYVRVFDTVEYFKSKADAYVIRDSASKYVGIDVAIVTDSPGADTGMYIPMNTRWCTAEVGAAQPIKDITYIDGAFIEGFTFCRTDNRYVYDPVRGIMVPETPYRKWEELEGSKPEFQEWLMLQITKPGDKGNVLN